VGSTNPTVKHKHNALLILANLALRSQLRGQIAASDGITLFLDVMKGNIRELRASVQAERNAAKGLLNMALVKQETRHTIIAQLSDELQSAFKGQKDPVVAGYLNSLVRSNDQQ